MTVFIINLFFCKIFTFEGFLILTICVTEPVLAGGIELPDGGLSCKWND
jgi:hypothetical protein